MDLEHCETILECITSICFLIGVWKCVVFFGYKNDENIRKLYIDNSKKVYEVLKNISGLSNIDKEHETLLKDALNEAEIYLHKDVIEYIKEIRQLSIELHVLQCELEKFPVGADKNNLCDELKNKDLQIEKLFEKHFEIYRKHIVHDSFFNKLWNLMKKLKNAK